MNLLSVTVIRLNNIAFGIGDAIGSINDSFGPDGLSNQGTLSKGTKLIVIDLNNNVSWYLQVLNVPTVIA